MKNKIIYVLHGWAYSTEKWQPFISELKKHNIDVEMLKIPGLTTPLEKVWEIDDYVEWLKKLIDKENDKVFLLGHSNGGRIALEFTIKYPEKIKQLILIDSAGIYHSELPIRLKRFVFGFIAKTGKRFTNSSRMRNVIYKFAREHDYENANPILQETMRNLIKVNHSNILQNIRIPTLIIWGENDKTTPISDAHIFNNGIKNSKLFFIKNAKHSPMFTNTKEVSEIIFKNI